MTVLANIPGHRVEAQTSRLESGVLYTNVECECGRSGPVSGSLIEGTAWSEEHIKIVVAARLEALRERDTTTR